MLFFKEYRKRGLGLTLEILKDFENGEAVESEFFNKLEGRIIKSFLIPIQLTISL